MIRGRESLVVNPDQFHENASEDEADDSELEPSLGSFDVWPISRMRYPTPN
jgi:hypothetical protein